MKKSSVVINILRCGVTQSYPCMIYARKSCGDFCGLFLDKNTFWSYLKRVFKLLQKIYIL